MKGLILVCLVIICSLEEISASGYMKACGAVSECNLRIVHGNENSNVAAIYNKQTQTAAAFDYNENCAVLYNGLTGSRMLLDLNDDTVSYYSRNSSRTWHASKTSFKTYIRRVKTLKTIKKREKKRVSYKTNAVSSSDLQSFNGVLTTLEPSVSNIVKINNNAGVSAFVKMSKTLCSKKKKYIWRSIKKRTIRKSYVVNGGVSKVTSAFNGIHSMVNLTNKKVENFVTQDLNYEPIFLSECGSESVSAFAKQVTAKEDVTKVMTPIIRRPALLYEVINQFGGGIYKELVGIEALVGHLAMFSYGLIPVETLADVMIQVAASIGQLSFHKVYSQLNFIIKVLEYQVEKYPTSLSLCSPILNFLTSIREQKLLIHRINISSILTVILTKHESRMRALVEILANLKGIIQLPEAMALLFFRMVYFVTTGDGLVFIHNLLPMINLKFDFHEPIMTQILSSVNKLELEKSLKTANIEGVLSQVPLFNEIYLGLVSSMSVVHTQKPLLLEGLSDVGLSTIILKWVKFGLGIQGGAQPRGHINGLGLIGGASSTLSIFKQLNSQYYKKSYSSSSSSTKHTSSAQSRANPDSFPTID